MRVGQVWPRGAGGAPKFEVLGARQTLPESSATLLIVRDRSRVGSKQGASSRRRREAPGCRSLRGSCPCTGSSHDPVARAPWPCRRRRCWGAPPPEGGARLTSLMSRASCKLRPCEPGANGCLHHHKQRRPAVSPRERQSLPRPPPGRTGGRIFATASGARGGDRRVAAGGQGYAGSLDEAAPAPEGFRHFAIASPRGSPGAQQDFAGRVALVTGACGLAGRGDCRARLGRGPRGSAARRARRRMGACLRSLATCRGSGHTSITARPELGRLPTTPPCRSRASSRSPPTGGARSNQLILPFSGCRRGADNEGGRVRFIRISSTAGRMVSTLGGPTPHRRPAFRLARGRHGSGKYGSPSTPFGNVDNELTASARPSASRTGGLPCRASARLGSPT